MNTERLHRLAIAILEDLNKTNVLQKFKQITEALKNQTNQPQQPQFQQQVSQYLKELCDALDNAPSNGFSPEWRQRLEELNIESILGYELKKQLKNIFERNQITPSVALGELQSIYQQVQKLKESVDHIIVSFQYLKIGAEDLNPGQCELGIIIPRSLNNKLEDFGKELSELNNIFATFCEVAAGNRPGFEIITISSSNFTVFCDLLPVVGACIAHTIERIIAAYKDILEIKLYHRKLAEKGIPKKDLKGIHRYADSHMSNVIDKLIPEILKEYGQGIEESRKCELQTELKFTLNKLARRIDKGYNIEIRIKTVEASDKSADKKSVKEFDKYVQSIKVASNGMQFIKTKGDPILTLPESVEKKRNRKNKKEKKQII